MTKSILSPQAVQHVADLANLPLSEEELKRFDAQLSATIEYVKDLEELDTKDVIPTSQVTGKTNEFREDIIRLGLTQAQALANAKEVHNGFFKVPKISWT